MDKRTLCVYHDRCLDGWGAAWVVRRALGADGVELVPGSYGDEPPDARGRDVVLVDFSYKRADLLALAERARSVLILDHHASAVTELVDLSANCRAVFDLEHSGVALAWNWYFGHLADEPMPYLLQIIQDRDLWRFRLRETRRVTAALLSWPWDWALWDRWMADPALALIQLEADGRAILRKEERDLAELLGKPARRLCVGGFDVPAVNLPFLYASEAGNRLSHGEPFAAVYCDGEPGRKFSLRSQPDGEDVSIVAGIYGGGGHARAAGFTVPWGHALAPRESVGGWA